MRGLIFFLAIIGTVVWLHDPQGAAQAGTSPTRKASGEIDKALADFRSAAARLEKAISRSAGEGTQELRKNVNKHVGSVLSEISEAMNHASQKLETRHEDGPVKPAPSASDAPAK